MDPPRFGGHGDEDRVAVAVDAVPAGDVVRPVPGQRLSSCFKGVEGRGTPRMTHRLRKDTVWCRLKENSRSYPTLRRGFRLQKSESMDWPDVAAGCSRWSGRLPSSTRTELPCNILNSRNSFLITQEHFLWMEINLGFCSFASRYFRIFSYCKPYFMESPFQILAY